MMSLRKSLLREDSKDSDIPRKAPKLVHWESSKEPQYLEIKKKILSKSSRLALICLLCWFTSLVAFIGGAALRFDLLFDQRKSRPSVSQLDALVYLSTLPYISGPLGFWGAYQRQHINVFLFSYVVFITSVVELSIGAVILSFSGEAIREDIHPEVKMETQDFGFIHAVQTKFHCCGAESPSDWIKSKWWTKKRGMKSNEVLPKSCCRLNEMSGKHIKDCNKGSDPFEKVDNPSQIYEVGCQGMVSTRLNDFLSLSGGLVFSMGLIKLASFFAMHVLVSQLLQLDRESVEAQRKPRRFSRPSIHHADLDRLHRQSLLYSVEPTEEPSIERGIHM